METSSSLPAFVFDKILGRKKILGRNEIVNNRWGERVAGVSRLLGFVCLFNCLSTLLPIVSETHPDRSGRIT